jgi:DNA-binding response OmpR family regulator
LENPNAGNGIEALESVQKQRPDLILSDVMMPTMNGSQVLKVLKDDLETSGIPIILLSARAGEEAVLEGLEKGADDYLVKPFSASELVARVKTQLEITRTRQDLFALSEAEERVDLP